jgi:pimeloyl-ACP methyl ester carboxylesterase
MGRAPVASSPVSSDHESTPRRPTVGGTVPGSPTSPVTRRVRTAREGGELELAVTEWNRPVDGDPSVVCVHGLASNRRMWDGVGAVLAARGHHVVSVDQRGHGESGKPTSGFDFDTVTGDLAALVAQVGAGPACVVGQSWGGNVVVEFAARYPSLASSVVCVDGGFIELSSRFSSWEDCRAALTPPKLIGTPFATMRDWIRSAHPDWPEEGIAGALANFEHRADGTIAPWLSLDRHLAILQALYEHRPAEALSGVRVPVHFVVADGDAAWERDKRHALDRLLRTVPQGSVEWLRGDHDLHAQHPVLVADEIERARRAGATSTTTATGERT